MSRARSRETGLILNKGDQSAFILCTAIYALAAQGEDQPTRKRVLTFIRVKKLIAYESLAADVWASEEKVWLQFFSWCREDIATNGLLAYRGTIDAGRWRLSVSGREFVERRIAKWVRLGKSPDQMLVDIRSFQQECIYSESFLKLVLQLGQNLNPGDSPAN